MTADRPLTEEKRDFFRINFNSPVEYKSYTGSEPVRASGRSQNISQSGILFQTETNPPALSSVVWMNLDIRTLRICQEIERRALIFNNGILGRVVRVEENPKSDIYEVGVCFLTQAEKNTREVQGILEEISKKA